MTAIGLDRPMVARTHVGPSLAARAMSGATTSLRAAVPALVGLVALAVAYEFAVTPLMYSRRQGEAIAALAHPSPVVTEGNPVAILQIPKLGMNLVVAEGDSEAILRGGPGHRAGTPLPGETGNAVVLGHRARYGGPFGSLAELSPGDEVYVQVVNGRTTKFVVAATRRHAGDDTAELAPSADAPRLTLVTSAGGLGSSERLVVVGSVDGATDPRRGNVGDAFEPDEGSVVFRPSTGLAYVSLVAAGMAYAYLRTRVRRRVTHSVAGVLVAGAAVFFLSSIELLLPATL